MRTIPLGDVCEVVMGQAPGGATYNTDGEGWPLLAGAGDFGENTPMPSKYTSKPTKVSAEGDLILCIRATIGDLNWSDKPYCLGRGVAGLKPKKGKLHPTYLWHWLTANKGELAKRGKGSTFKQVSRDDIKTLDISLSDSFDEQRRLAAILDKADAIRHKRRQALALADDFLRAAFLEMFGDLGKNPRGWEVVTVGDIVSEVRDGPHVSPEYAEEGIPILSTRNIRQARLVMDDIKYISQDSYKILTKRFKPQRGDVLLTKGGTTGLAKEVDFDWPFAVWVHLACLRPNRRVLPGFLEAALNSRCCYQQSQKYTHGIANKDLGLTRIVKITLGLPPVPLQRQFILLRDRYKLLQSSLADAASKAEAMFASLSQRAFRGEL